MIKILIFLRELFDRPKLFSYFWSNHSAIQIEEFKNGSRRKNHPY